MDSAARDRIRAALLEINSMPLDKPAPIQSEKKQTKGTSAEKPKINIKNEEKRRIDYSDYVFDHDSEQQQEQNQILVSEVDDGVDRSQIERNAYGTEEPSSAEPELWNIDNCEVDILVKYKMGGQLWYVQSRLRENPAKDPPLPIPGYPMNRKAEDAKRFYIRDGVEFNKGSKNVADAAGWKAIEAANPPVRGRDISTESKNEGVTSPPVTPMGTNDTADDGDDNDDNDKHPPLGFSGFVFEQQPHGSDLDQVLEVDDGVDRSQIERNAYGTEEPSSAEPELWNIDNCEVDILVKYKMGGQLWYVQSRLRENPAKDPPLPIPGYPMNRKAEDAKRFYIRDGVEFNKGSKNVTDAAGWKAIEAANLPVPLRQVTVPLVGGDDEAMGGAASGEVEEMSPGEVDDNASDDSDQPVVNIDSNDDDMLGEGSLDSIVSNESINELEILAQDNAEKNRDILHESFLSESRKNFLEVESRRMDQAGEGTSSVGPNSYNSVEGDTKSVTFADEDYIVEFDKYAEFPAVIPLNMDPYNEYMLHDNDTSKTPEAVGIFPDPRAEDTTQPFQEYTFDTPAGNGVNDLQVSDWKYRSCQRMPVVGFQLEEDASVVPSGYLGNDHSHLYQKIEQLMRTSPEFRNAVLAFPVGDEARDEAVRREAENRLVESLPRDRKVTLKTSYQPFSDVLDNISEQGSEVAAAPANRPPVRSKRVEDYRKKVIGGRNASSSAKARIPSAPTPKKEFSSSDVLLSSSSYSSQRASAVKDFLERLAQGTEEDAGLVTTPSLEFAPEPPKLCTDYPNIPIDGIHRLNEVNLTGDNYLIPLEPCEEKLRLRIKATDCSSDWEYSNRMDFFGLHFSRSEFMEFPRAAQREKGSSLEFDDGEIGGKRKLLINHEDAYEFLYVNRSKFLKKTKPHVAQLNAFVHKYFLGFTFLVFDMKMQLLGTFDHKLGKHCPGITVCPPHLNKRKRRSDDHRFANLFEVDFAKLPPDVFAIVPVIYDDSPMQAKFPELHLQFDLSLSEIAVTTSKGGRRDSYWMSNACEDDDSEATPLHGQFDVANVPSRWHLLEQVGSPTSMSTLLPSHVDQMDNSWTHLESFFATRTASLQSPNLHGPPDVAINPQETQSRVSIYYYNYNHINNVIRLANR